MPFSAAQWTKRSTMSAETGREPVLSTGLMRTPYTVMVAYQIGNPERDVPKVDTQLIYDMGNSGGGNNGDGLGWRELPGCDRIL